MTPDEYMQERVDKQIAWYDAKSGANQRGFKRARIIEIIAATLIPILSGYSDKWFGIQVTVAVLGGAIAVAAGLTGLHQYQENWRQFRSTCEALRHEKYLYETKGDPYNVADPFPLFVQRIESLISTEHARWTQSMRGGKKQEEEH